MFDNHFEIRIDSSECTSLIEGGAFLDNKIYDCWRYKDITLNSGKIYGIIGEYGQGPMYLSYLLGGRIEHDDLKIYCNDRKLSRDILEQYSWNLEPSKERYKNAVVKKAIEKALSQNDRAEDFNMIAEKFLLTEPRYSRKLSHLSGERWRASAALGYSCRRKIFYAPYNPSSFYYSMCQSGLLTALRALTADGAVVLLPAGSDKVLKYIADECIYTDRSFDIEKIKNICSN